MLGNEKCTAVCCGKEITMNETARETNHKVLYGINLVYSVFGVIMIVLAITNLASTQLMKLFPFVEPVVYASANMGWLMVFSAILGVLGTRWRSKRALICWSLVVILVTIAELIVAAVMVSSLSNDTFDKYSGTTFLANWKALVASAETKSEDLTWIQGIQSEGTCCGWLDVNDADENPSYLDCDVTYTKTCSEFFKDAVTSKFGSLQHIAMAISILQLMIFVFVMSLICRFKEFYKGENIDFGDYKHVPYGGKVKTIDELIA
mmetsp:Transcript_17699/g.36739  ORF Transcript_17699/g.36739 Transcript_17699/m.36739 type:complete len:263 (+) Transcript_17699:104-892(+)